MRRVAELAKIAAVTHDRSGSDAHAEGFRAATAARTNFFMMDSIDGPPVSKAGRFVAGWVIG